MIIQNNEIDCIVLTDRWRRTRCNAGHRGTEDNVAIGHPVALGRTD